MIEINGMDEREKMTRGHLYDASLGGLPEMRRRAHDLCRKYNGLSEVDGERETILAALLGEKGEGVFFQGPIQFDYGFNTVVGARSYFNFNLTCLDCAPVRIGKDVFIGPNVSLLTPMHPLRYEERNARMGEDGQWHALEYARPIEIEDDCWIAGNVTICGGVRIGRGCVIGAGSVVTHDIAAHQLAVGVPCRARRAITEADTLFRNDF